MKKRLLFTLTVFLFVISSHVLADNEVVKAATSDTQTSDPSKLGPVNPCDKVKFIVTFTIPANYNRVKKYEWYFNNVLVYTGTNPDDPYANLTMDDRNGSTVTCKVTYYNDLTNAVSAPYTAAAFSPQIRLAAINDITQSGVLVQNCTNPVSFSTSIITNNNLLYVPPPSDYTIKWILPANWSFASGSTGNTITANPDGVTTGNVSAYLQMTICPYSSSATPRILPVSYNPTQPPALITSNSSACGGNQDYSIQGACGAVSYTYSIVTGAAGVVFTSNGQRTLTTTATTANISFPSTGGDFTLSVAANYAGGQTSSAVSNTYNYGLPPMSVYIVKWIGSVFRAQATAYPGAQYHWMIGNLPGGGSLATCVGEPPCGENTRVSVYATGACGTTNTAAITVNPSCTGGGPKKLNVTPNPSQGLMRVSLVTEERKAIAAGKGRQVKAARIVDKAGRIVRKFEFGAGVPEAFLNTSGLATDIYILQIFDGTQWVHQEIIVK